MELKEDVVNILFSFSKLNHSPVPCCNGFLSLINSLVQNNVITRAVCLLEELCPTSHLVSKILTLLINFSIDSELVVSEIIKRDIALLSSKLIMNQTELVLLLMRQVSKTKASKFNKKSLGYLVEKLG